MGSKGANSKSGISISPKVTGMASTRSAKESERVWAELVELRRLFLEQGRLTPKSTATVACQTDGGLPLVASADSSVQTDGPESHSVWTETKDAKVEEAEWRTVTSSGCLTKRGPRQQLNSVPSVPMSNRFAILDEAGCSNPVPDGNAGPSASGEAEVLLMGDSLVRGVRAGKPGQATTLCYPGVRVEHLTSRVEAALGKASQSPVVVLHVGTNNLSSSSPGQLRGRVRQLFQAVRRVRPLAKVVYSNITPRDDSRSSHTFHPNLAVQRYSHELFELCRHSGVTWVDAAPDLLRDPKRYYLPDRLHLTEEGKVIMGGVLGRCVSDLMSN